MKVWSVLGGLLVSLVIPACSPVWALMQTEMEILGVSPNLMQLGVVEKWVADGSGFAHCEVRLYQRNQWDPVQTQIIDQSPDDTEDTPAFDARCQALQDELKEQAHLQSIDWDLAEISPQAPAIKDTQGRLLPGNEAFEKAYPIQARYEFTLPPDTGWVLQLHTTSTPNPWQFAQQQRENPNPSAPQPRYLMALQPQLEPVPVDTIDRPFLENQVLLRPLKLLINNHYGIVALIFRDYRLGFEGFDYHYRPYFIQWPDYQPMSVEEAKATLMGASDFALAAHPLVKGPNTMHPGNRAFQRLKAERLPVEDLLTALDRASHAGKLYWLALLHDQDTRRYQVAAQTLLQQTPPTSEVIQSEGSHWRSRPFIELLRQQAAFLKVAL